MTVAGHRRTRFGSTWKQWRRWSRRPSVDQAGRTATGGVVRGPHGVRPPKGKVKRRGGGCGGCARACRWHWRPQGRGGGGGGSKQHVFHPGTKVLEKNSPFFIKDYFCI